MYKVYKAPESKNQAVRVQTKQFQYVEMKATTYTEKIRADIARILGLRKSKIQLKKTALIRLQRKQWVWKTHKQED